MSNKIKFDNFDLLCIEIIGKKKVKIKFYDRELPNREQVNDDKNLPHQDLISCLEALNVVMAKGLGLTKGWDFAREALAGKKDLDNLKLAKDGAESQEDGITVSKLVFTGEARAGIQLSGSVQTDFGIQKQTTPIISLDSTKYDIAETAKILSEEVKKEAFAYLFQNKFVKTEKKKKEDEEKAALDKFDNAINNGGVFSASETEK